MRLSWNEIRTRASKFVREWGDAAYEKGETQSFYNEFFEIFGVRRRSVARYEEHVKKLDRRVSGPHRRDRAVDDGSHHEQSAEPGVRPELCPHSA